MATFLTTSESPADFFVQTKLILSSGKRQFCLWQKRLTNFRFVRVKISIRFYCLCQFLYKQHKFLYRMKNFTQKKHLIFYKKTDSKFYVLKSFLLQFPLFFFIFTELIKNVYLFSFFAEGFK